VASSPPLIGLFQVRVIKRNYRADGSHFSSTLRGRRTASRLRSDPSGGAVGCRVSEAVYDAWLIDIYKGDQFGSGFVDLNPNSKIPALIDYGAVKPVRIFESGANLLYLAEKFGRFIPLDVVGRMKYMSWLF
jgi:glutathione S-transferase